MPVHFKGRSEYTSHYKTMPVNTSGSTAGQPSILKETSNEPGLQRKKRTPFRPDQVFTLRPEQEPHLQAKKRIEPHFMKTSPVKSEQPPVMMQSKHRVDPPKQPKTLVEPVMQSKKRVEPEIAKTPLLLSMDDPVPIQHKKHVEAPPDNKSIPCEPPLQSKRRAQGPAVTLGANFYNQGRAQDDFALLGNQEKFTTNVPYRVRSSLGFRDISPPKQPKLQLKQKENLVPSSTPAPVVDTEQFRQPATPLAPRRPKPSTQHPPAQEVQKSSIAREQRVAREPKVKRSPVQQTSDFEVRKSQAKAEQAINRSEKEIEEKLNNKEVSTEKSSKLDKGPKTDKSNKSSKLVKDAKSASEEKETTVNKKEMRLNLNEVNNMDRSDPVKTSMKVKHVDNMNEFAQTNMDKGVTDSAPEAPADYALRYKTGISAPRPSKKMSEYQKQFSWKAGLPASPLLKAEQVVYNSNPQLVPPKKDVIPKVSEYQKQFKAYKLVPVPSQQQESVPKRVEKIRRSKSMEDLSPADIPTAGTAPVISPNNKRLTLETDQVVPEPAPQVPVKKSRKIKSEYDSNFKSPTRFNYLRGSWHGANPPQLQMQVEDETGPVPAISNWFAEVLELRRKAKEYSVRAQGTHFSREHLVQLMAKQTDLWEASTTATTSRSTISALSLEDGRAGKGIVLDDARVETRSTAATCATEDDHVSEQLSVADDSPPQKKLAWSSDDAYDGENVETPSTLSDEVLSGEGRKTTPKLREQLNQKGNVRRHHLDRTTPSVGGALLSSPPCIRKKRTGKKMVAKSLDSVSVGTVEEEDQPATPTKVHRPLAGQQTYTADKGYIAPTPTFGMPSRDTHFLRDDSKPTDSLLQTQFVYTPARKSTPGGLDAINEGFGQTYNRPKMDDEFSWAGVPRGHLRDDDVISLSERSVASSCSLASFTLEKARRRKEEFWGKNGIATR